MTDGQPEFAIEFGWPGDGGIGEMLIGQILRGEKTATCGFKRAYTERELADELGAVGRVVPVIDASGATRCHIRVLDAFETRFGDPDARLVAGEGDGDDVAKFQADHRVAWRADFGDQPLLDDEPLVVLLFELEGALDRSVNRAAV